jgi:hypothetical protein
MIASTSSVASSAFTADFPISPVGPVTATVIPMSDAFPVAGAGKPLEPAQPASASACLAAL